MKIEVCMSPDLLPRYDVGGKSVVVIDVLRATSCMVTAFAHGVKAIIPVKEVERCRQWQQKGYLAAAERNGQKVEGFDLDNSPFSYMQERLKGQTLVVTTTNGTTAIEAVKGKAAHILTGAFLNKQAVIDTLRKINRDVLLLCAGWKGRVNMEDTLFAGAVVAGMPHATIEDDAALMAADLYRLHRHNKMEIMRHCSHVQRLKRLGIEKDIEFCLQEDLYPVVPVLQEDRLVAFTAHPAFISSS
ncbi:MAG: putative 2-phosphosulfolactate phosphatase [Thermonema sp.]|uniref:2-phosphosulfolactate phosphatase n=1 Tax=Thermonema TaxID=28194 RepID=UPI000689FEB5|nr:MULTISPECIES: 2-phosphosulfolactate phosphatase [Thermonema]GIV40052.1 MAG: putative 2-phosphosulfolactate phosphatase [Thermonema sp.]